MQKTTVHRSTVKRIRIGQCYMLIHAVIRPLLLSETLFAFSHNRQHFLKLLRVLELSGVVTQTGKVNIYARKCRLSVLPAACAVSGWTSGVKCPTVLAV